MLPVIIYRLIFHHELKENLNFITINANFIDEIGKTLPFKNYTKNKNPDKPR